MKASELVDAAKPLLEEIKTGGSVDQDIDRYVMQLKPLRIQCHKMVGQIFASEGDMAACEAEFRRATDSFPSEPSAWQMLARVLEIQGKTEEAKEIADKVKSIVQAAGWIK